MTSHKRFHYKTVDELKADIRELKADIPVADTADALVQAVHIDGKKVPNRMAVNPMEGCDGKADGAPDELTVRRYQRFARGGAGLLWFEATAVVPEGRANPRQISMNENTVDAFRSMLEQSIAQAQAVYGQEHRPYTVLQLTHSGRYSKPVNGPAPIIAGHNLYLDKFLPENYTIIADEQLEELEDKYVEAAVLAAQAGFDAVDVKACHGYLLNELLGARMREGRYGGTFENRARFITHVVDKIHKKVGNRITLASRMNAYDAIPYPYGWGVSQDDFHQPDFSEPIRLVRLLHQKGLNLLNVTCGNPYYNPHVNRPYDMGTYIPPMHQLENAAILLNAARQIKAAIPEIVVVGSGLSWFRQFGANVAAGCIEQGWFDIAGFGRQSFAYPDFAADIIKQGRMDERKVCLACSKCTCIMRDGGQSGCVPRDAAVYGPIYLEGRKGKSQFESTKLAEHI